MVYILRKIFRDMASMSMNPYEEQLYTVFKTFDVDNEEALDRSSVLQLCDTLQLEDRGAALVDTLFERQSDRVTFAQFRNGLLSVLGSETVSHPEHSKSKECNHVVQPNASLSPHSDDDSSGREVAPKFVFGSKKYGRRSRPQRTASEESPRHRVASESRLDCARSRQRMRCKRSASAMESRDDSAVDDDSADLDHDRRVNRDRALALCRGLHMHGVDRCLVDRIFEASAAEELTVGEFFDQLNSSLTTSIAASLDGLSTNESSTFKTDVVSSDTVVEAWERAGVERPKRLLIELGFATAALRPFELERVLDEELRALAVPSDAATDARSLLLLAAHALTRMRLDSAWRLLDVARAERDKLRDDLAEANGRARMLAQDVDENHARIEAELKSSLRQVEARHAEAVRVAAAETAAERERAAAAHVALEEEATRRAETEAKMRAEIACLRERIDEVQERLRAAEVRAMQAEREQAKAQEVAREAEERGVRLAEREREAAGELNARLHELRSENQRLRDRNDELCSALEVSSRCAAVDAHIAPSWRDEVAMNVPAKLEECDLSLLPNERKPIDSREIFAKLKVLFKSIESFPTSVRGGCRLCRSVSETISSMQRIMQEQSEEMLTPSLASNVCIKTDVALQTEPNVNNAEDIELLKKDLIDIKQKYEAEKQNSSTVIKELESSLEQMKVEYDKCEDYWTCKLEDEREAFAEEQRAGDERLADLVSKIADYERQFAPVAAHPHGLPTIDEKCSLELQFTDLEEEFAKYRTEKEVEITNKAEEIKRLKAKVEELERRQPPADGASRGERRTRESPPERPLVLHCADSHDVATCARWRAGAAAGARESGALRARAARAERAAQRLHARLAAADLLVKDLYIENCRLAHLPRLP
ncbi:blastoderm-specific protein 25D [Vanessa atalanta]|uniref:blastoderm-specific protein 25D n=1 Tax=Vanessa atalanta TaxID=42275 RepID=UPI001FCD55A2|nr:blastoderm-specific protein 25D [Vanessa atalanta]